MNRLASETSPYLQQHADNPVDWWPWCDDALKLAREQNKPILLSIGYSACHWCHVMAHESFEDAQVAALMNRLYVNIKVDREERPDLDQIYQTAHQMFSQRSGGWPLTMFLTPDGTPFYGGTYFPKTARHGLPAFTDLLERIAEAFGQQHGEILEQNEKFIAALQTTVPQAAKSSVRLNAETVSEARDVLLANFDRRYGGFGRAPKFPHPSDLALLNHHASLHGDDEARHACLHTLRRMAEGGLYDHLGGSFARYSVDERWNIPHFEKMLYDNGPLLSLYAQAWAHTDDALFLRVVHETAAWVMREMQSPEGGYYASLDADSEGEEGKFYVWQREQVQALLSPSEYGILAAHYGLNAAPNFEQSAWHFHVARPLSEVAAENDLPEPDARAVLDGARAKLFVERELRVRPARDEKILTSWNALMIAGMARAGALCGRDDWVKSAQAAMDFIYATLWRDGRLLATYKDGKAHLNAYLDDHAFLLHATLELMQASFRPCDLQFAQLLADALIDQFEDVEQGGFFFTRHDHERLILRPKPGHDGATPSGNGVAAFALQRFGHLVGNARYLQAAERCVALFQSSIRAHPGGYSTLIETLAEFLQPPTVVILRGQAQAWLAQVQARHPSTLSILLPDDTGDLPAALSKPREIAATAYVCRGTRCLSPIRSWPELEKALQNA